MGSVLERAELWFCSDEAFGNDTASDSNIIAVPLSVEALVAVVTVMYILKDGTSLPSLPPTAIIRQVEG